MHFNVRLYHQAWDYLLNVWIPTSVLLGSGYIYCSLPAASVLRAMTVGC